MHGLVVYCFAGAVFVVLCLWPVGGQKKYPLRVLHLVPATGLQKRIQTLYDVTLMLAEIANNRSDILPDYNIEMQFEDEGLGNVAAGKLVNFARSLDSKEKAVTFNPSPLVFGPQYSSGCKAIGPIMPYLKMVDLSSSCAATIFADHSLYPNMYLMFRTGQVKAMAQLRFIRDIGNWKRFGILANSGNVNDYGAAMFMQKAATDLQMDIAVFTMVVNVDEQIVISLVEADIRVVVFFTATDTQLIQFLCLAHRFGMKGARFVFILNYTAFSDPTQYPEVFTFARGCTKAILIEQCRQTFWVGPAYEFYDRTIKSEWGYSMTDFDEMLYQKFYRNNTRPGDYMSRYLYYDNALLGFYALHDAEETLRKNNMSLRDYPTHPDIVMKVVNQSVLQINRGGIRIGKMSYAKNGIVEGDLEVVAHWLPSYGSAANNIATIRQMSGVTDFIYESYYTRQVLPIPWLTANNMAPRDGKQLTTSALTLPSQFATAIQLLAAISILCQMASIFTTVIWTLKKKRRIHYPFSKVVAYTGCAIMNISIIVSTSSAQISKGTWVAGMILLVIGCSLQNGVNVMLAFSCVPTTEQTTETSQDKKTAGASGLFLLLNCAVLTAWLVTDPPSCKQELTRAAFYIYDIDTLISEYAVSCNSKYIIPFVLTLAGLQLLILLVGGYICYEAYRRVKRSSGSQPVEFNNIRIAVINSFTLLVCSALIVAILRHPINGQIVIAIGTLLMSSSEMAILVSPYFSEKNSVVPGSEMNTFGTVGPARTTQRISTSGARSVM